MAGASPIKHSPDFQDHRACHPERSEGSAPGPARDPSLRSGWQARWGTRFAM